jgi:hypothetical protein
MRACQAMMVFRTVDENPQMTFPYLSPVLELSGYGHTLDCGCHFVNITS